jgi:hypothetical protein
MVRNGIPCCFSSAERFGREFREFASISVPRNGIPCCFSSAEGFGRDFREFASISVPRNGNPRCFLFRGRVRNGIPRNSVPRNSRNSVGNDHLFRQFRLPRNFFLSEIPNPSYGRAHSIDYNTVSIVPAFF